MCDDQWRENFVYTSILSHSMANPNNTYKTMFYLLPQIEYDERLNESIVTKVLFADKAQGEIPIVTFSVKDSSECNIDGIENLRYATLYGIHEGKAVNVPNYYRGI